jgi:hypothetical protein
MKSIRRLGCGGDSIVFDCEECGAVEEGGIPASAFFQVGNGQGRVVVCQDRIYNSQKSLRENVLHELIHAYDYCRVRSRNSLIPYP